MSTLRSTAETTTVARSLLLSATASPGVATVVYVNDDQGFSVELLHVEPQALERMGFRPPRVQAAA